MPVTRKERALKLLDLVHRGPVFSDPGSPMTAFDANEQYRRWAESWILDELQALVPELKEAK